MLWADWLYDALAVVCKVSSSDLYSLESAETSMRASARADFQVTYSRPLLPGVLTFTTLTKRPKKSRTYWIECHLEKLNFSLVCKWILQSSSTNARSIRIRCPLLLPLFSNWPWTYWTLLVSIKSCWCSWSVHKLAFGHRRGRCIRLGVRYLKMPWSYIGASVSQPSWSVYGGSSSSIMHRSGGGYRPWGQV